MRLRRYSWAEYERAVRVLRFHPDIHWYAIGAVHGEPRGGLCLAASLSNYKDIPITNHTGGHVLWVDDLYSTGRTYRARGKPFYGHHAVWLRRYDAQCPIVYVDTVPQGEWPVLPWEDPVRAQRAMETSQRKQPPSD